MATAIVIYYTRTGNTEEMANIIGETLENEGIDTSIQHVENTDISELQKHDGIIIGSPTYYGTMAAEIKKFLDESVQFHGKLDGKVGGAFASAGHLGGGNETTVLSILEGLLIHGIIVQGDPEGDHYGPCAVGAPDERARQECENLGRRMADLIKKLE